MSQEELSRLLQLEGVVLDRFAVAKIEAGTRFVADYELFVLAQILEVNMENLCTK